REVPTMTFDAERVSLELIIALREPLERLELRNRAHADQTRRAASSVAHNLSEGRRRAGRDRFHLWRTAAGSAAELRTALAIAEVGDGSRRRSSGPPTRSSTASSP